MVGTHPACFINYGGGPCFFLDTEPMRDTWRELEAILTLVGRYGNRLRVVTLGVGY